MDIISAKLQAAGCRVTSLEISRNFSDSERPEDKGKDIRQMYTSCGELAFAVCISFNNCRPQAAEGEEDKDAGPLTAMKDRRIHLSMDIYDSEWTMVSSAETGIARYSNPLQYRLSPDQKTGTLAAVIRARPQIPLIPGQYTALLMISRVAIYKIRFSFDAMMEISDISHSPIEINSEECEAFTGLDHENVLWTDLCTRAGAGNLRIRTLDALEKNTINKKRKSLGLRGLPQNNNYIFRCRHDMETGFAIQDFIGLVHTPINPEKYYRADCEDLMPQVNMANPTEETDKFISDCSTPKILFNLSALNDSSGRTVIKKLSKSNVSSFLLAGTESEISCMDTLYPDFMARFPEQNRLDIKEFDVADIFLCLEHLLKFLDLRLSPDAEDGLVREAFSARENGILRKLGYTGISDFLRNSVRPKYESRLIEMYDPHDEISKEEYATIKMEDIDADILFTDRSEEFSKSMEALDSLIGLKSVKKHFSVMFNRISAAKLRMEMGLKAKEDNIWHMIFSGNPGTGKTTVAELLGRIFRALGVISKGNVIKVERKDIVGRFIGDTEKTMSDLLKEARGNVLFIDEAYQLFTGQTDDKRDFGNRAIESLLTVLTEKDPDMVVILAGYGAEMDSLLDSNPGLRDRFPFKFTFDDYTADELYEIAVRINETNDYEFEEEAAHKFREIIAGRVAEKDKIKNYSNARWIGTLLKKEIYSAQNERIIAMDRKDLTADDLRLIKVSDVDSGYAGFISHENIAQSRKPGRIGF